MMMRRNLTAKLIDNLKPASERRYEVHDTLVVARRNGPQVRHTLGTYPIVMLGEAREAARLGLKDVQLGLYAPRKPASYRFSEKIMLKQKDRAG